MQWSNNIREPIKLSIVDISKHSKVNISANKWVSLRNTTLKKYNYSCRYCGGKYMKYLLCIHLDNNSHNNDINNLDLCCRACYIITHINSSFNNEIQLCSSELSQTDIIKKTVNYIANNNKIPNVLDIDQNAKILKLSIMELANILVSNSYINATFINQLEEFNNYKIFFTQEFDTTFIDANIKLPMFIDDKEIDNSNLIDNLNLIDNNTMDIYEFSKNENTFFNTIFKK